MAGWFDKHAKKSAERAQTTTASATGISRRRVLVGGTTAVAAAWTAPVLMASSAAAAGLSVCPSDRIKTCTDGSQTCCPNATDTCNIVNGAQVCSAISTPGGYCGNCGQGTCPEQYKCNGNPTQSNNAEGTNLCGGEGAQCCASKPNVATCYGDTLVCVEGGGNAPGSAFCRKECTSNNDCRTTGVKPGNENCPQKPPGQVCSAGYCAKTCNSNSDCNGNATCAAPAGGGAKVCGYNTDGNLSATCAA